MDQLVPDDVVQIAERSARREHDPAPESLGHSAGALADAASYGIGLLELGRAGVEDQRLAAGQLVVEDAGSRAYHRSAIRAACPAAASSGG